MNDPVKDEAAETVSGNEEPDDTKAFDGFAADVHGKPGGSKWAERLGVEARVSDFEPIPSTKELLDQVAQIPLAPLPQRGLRATEHYADEAIQVDSFSIKESSEEGLRGSVWRLDQRTAVNFARAQGAFIAAQNAFLKDRDTARMASAQHLFIEAQADVLAKFGVV